MQSWHIAHGYEALTGERKPCWLEESGESMRLWPAFYSLLRAICQFYSLNQDSVRFSYDWKFHR